MNYFKRVLKAIPLSFLLVAVVITARAQQQFMVGSSKVSIDPDSTVFSLPLAGYGAPREGRFDLQWQYRDSLDGIRYLASAADRLYAVNDNGELLAAATIQPAVSWKKIAAAKNIITLTGGPTSLYAVTAGNDVIVFDLLKRKGWQKIGTAANVTAITLFRGKLFAATANNQLLQGTIAKGTVNWKQVAEANHFTVLANDGVKIYGVDAENTMWFIKPGSQMVWLKIGVNNRSTYTIPLKQLLLHKKRLYTLSKDDKLFIAAHTTDHTLFARSLAIRKNNKTVVIVTLDLTGFDYSLAKEVKEIIYKKRKIPPSAILINASHTHFAPVSQWFPTFGEHGQIPDSIWFNNTLKKGIIRSIELALDHLAPETIWFGRGSTGIGYNRSSPDGKTPNDTTMDVLKFVNRNNKTNELIFSAGCHPVFRNEGKEGVTISANYPGVTRNLLEEQTGASTALFVQGCGGDINPVNDDHDQTGKDLASDVLDVLNKNMHPLDGEIRYTMDSISIPTQPWSKEKIIEYKNENLKEPGNVYAEKNVRWANMMLNYYAHDAVPATMPVYVQTITVGNWKLVGLSREVVTEYGPAIRAAWPDNHVTVAGYCNDVPSYLPVGRHIKTGTYEGVDSFFWNAQPSLFPVDIFDRIIEAIRKLKNK